MNRCIVIGANHHNTLGCIRSLGEAGIRPEVIITSFGKSFVAKSKYIDKIYFISKKEQILTLLQNKIVKPNEKGVIISCTDGISEFLDEHKEKLLDKYFLPVCSKENKLSYLQDKNIMTDSAITWGGVNVPRIWTIPFNLKEITFPCISKPVKSVLGNKSDIQIFNSQEELEIYLKNINDEIFLQQYIDKKEEFQFIGVSLNYGERIIIPGMTKIIRSVHNTNTGFLQYLPISDRYKETYNKAVNFVKRCQYQGLFSVEFIRDYKNTDYFLEINFRNDGNAYSVTASGVNLPAIWYNYNTDPLTQIKITQPKKILVMPEFQDLKFIIKKRYSLLKWMRDVKKTDTFLLYNKNDKKPFLYFLIYKIFK